MSERASQFAAFSPLRGYDFLLRNKERVVVSKKELPEEAARLLSDKLNKLKKGMMAEIIHYENEEYISTMGVISNIDICSKKLTVVKKEILFDDIYDVVIKKEVAI